MSEDVRRLVGENAKRLRMAAGLSQARLAELIGVDRSYVSGLEKGGRNPTVVTLWHLSVALKVPIARLFATSSKSSAPNRRVSSQTKKTSVG